MIRELEHLPYEDRLRELGGVQLEKAPETPDSGLPVLKGGHRNDGEGLCQGV